MNRRGFAALLSALVAALLPWRKAAGYDMRPLSQWQWRAHKIGNEVEEMCKRILLRCDIGRGRGTVVSAPHSHNGLHIWVDMDDHKVAAAHEAFTEGIPGEFQTRSYVVSVPVLCVLTTSEDDLAWSLQRALDAGAKDPQVRQWSNGLAPDSYEKMVDVTDYLPSKDRNERVVGLTTEPGMV